jgi:anti-sigma B factor antagonist
VIVNVDERDLLAVFHIQGSVDTLSSEDLLQEFMVRIQTGRCRLVVDLSQVDYLSSAGLRSILTALKESHQEGGDLRLVAPQPRVAQILELAGLTPVLKTYGSIEEGVASFSN